MKPKRERNLKFIPGKDGKSGYFVSELTISGKRVRRFAGYSKEQARTFISKLRLAGCEDGGLDSLLKPEKTQPATFGSYARALLDSAEWKQKRSAARDETSFKNLNRKFKDVKLSDIRPNMVRDFMTEEIKRSLRPASVNRERSLLVSVLYAAVSDGLIETNCIGGRGVKRLEEDNSREQIILQMGLTDEDMRRLIDKASPTLRPIVQTALLTGMRLGEILSLKWSQVDFKKLVLTIPRERAKSKKERTIPLSSDLVETLSSVERRGEYVFENGNGEQRKSIRTAYKAACRRAEIPTGRKGLRFHDLRHMAASNLVKVTDLATASKILGHSDVKMTMRYVHASDLDKRTAMEGLGDWLRGRQNHVNGSEGQPQPVPQTQAVPSSLLN
jgi:integrase